FCPTGGITPETAPEFLALPNVPCVATVTCTTSYLKVVPMRHRAETAVPPARAARAKRRLREFADPRRAPRASAPAHAAGVVRARRTALGGPDATRPRDDRPHLEARRPLQPVPDC